MEKPLNITPEEVALLVRTKKEKEQFLWDCDDIATRMFTNTTDITQLLATNVSYERKQTLLTLLEKNTVDLKSQPAVAAFFTALRTLLLGLTCIAMTIAFAPSEATIDTLITWYIRAYKEPVLFSFTIDETVVGGAVIAYDGNVRDYTLSQQVIAAQKKIAYA